MEFGDIVEIDALVPPGTYAATLVADFLAPPALNPESCDLLPVAGSSSIPKLVA